MLADKSKSKETLHTKLFQNVYTMRKEKETLNAMRKGKRLYSKRKERKLMYHFQKPNCLSRMCDVRLGKKN
jgi:hypothetical protein